MQICKNFAPIKTHILLHEPLRVEANVLIILELRYQCEKYLHKIGECAFDYLKKYLHKKCQVNSQMARKSVRKH